MKPFTSLSIFACPKCAKEQGGVWPISRCVGGYTENAFIGVCDACKEVTAVCPVDSWDWPRTDSELSVTTKTLRNWYVRKKV